MVKKSRLSNTQKKKIKESIDRAMRACTAGRYDMCERLCKQIDTVQPDNADVAFMRGAMLLAMHGIDQALPYMQEAVELAPRRVDFRINLGSFYLQTFRYDFALACFKDAEAIDEKSTLVLLGCCEALIGLCMHAKAQDYLARIRGMKLKLPQEYMQLARIFRELGEIDEAMSVLNELTGSFPDFVQGLYTKAMTAMQLGDKELAREAIGRTLELDPVHSETLMLMAESESFDSMDDPRVKMIQQALEFCPDDSSAKAYVLHAMAHVKKNLGDYPASFECSRQANEISASLREYDAEGALNVIERMIEDFSSSLLQDTSGIVDEKPIFVVGLPRCGSTMVEQILVAHSDVSGRGEIGALSSVLRESFDGDVEVEQLSNMTREQCAEVGREYMQRLRESGPDTRFIVDKSLGNILYLGVIRRALPGARVVHVRRHPLDNCLSIYTTNMLGSMFDYGLKLDTLGAYYLKYLELMRHWRKTLPAGTMYELEYEQLVADQEGETRKLLDACGLPWEEACLEFQKARQRVNTASIMQVRKPMYGSSVARWKRYEKELSPLIDILGTDYPPRD